jgi:hypothetical protein
MLRTMSSVTSTGAARPGDQCRGDDDVGRLDALGHQCRLTLHPGLGHRPGIAAHTLCDLAFLVGLERHINELGAE